MLLSSKFEANSETKPDPTVGYEGHHEAATCEVICGWARRLDGLSEPVDVEIWADSILLSVATADQFRKDLQDAGKTSGCHAFRYGVPFWLKDGKPHWIRAKVAGSNFDLTGTPRLIQCESPILIDIRNIKTKVQRDILRVRRPTKNYPLAIFAPSIGALTETFIRRHMDSILPAGTAVLTDTVDGQDGGHWSVNCPVFVVNNNQGKDAMSEAKRFLTEHGVQVLMGEYLNESLRWLEVAHELGIRFFAHAHGYDISQLLRDAKWRDEYRRLNQADGIVTMSEASRSRLVDLGLNPTKVYVVPYGVTVPSKPMYRTAAGVVRCLAVGRMVAKKGPILTLDAFRRAREVCPQLRLDYVGGGSLLSAARQFTRAFNMESFIRLHDSQPKEIVDRLMREADIFLQHSIVDPDTGDEEGLPVAVLEAMAHSLPVISTWHAGIPEAVRDGFSGYLVQEGDTRGMADRLIALACDPELRHQVGEKAWSQAREYFTWERERTDLLTVFRLTEESA